MRNIYFLFAVLLALTACTKDFDEINTNPNEPDSIDPRLQFSYVLNKAASESFEQLRGNILYCSIWSQQFSGPWETDRYNTTNEEWLSAWWVNSYLRTGKDLYDVITRSEEGSNLRSMATIFKVLFFQRVTDMYGDMPYSEANQGASFPQPRFDRQEDIYLSFIDELTTAINDLDASKDAVGSADIIYNGDVEKWRKFGASLLMRVGMRLSKVNPALAEQAIKTAAELGPMTSNADIAYITFSGTDTNGPNANAMGEIFLNFGVNHMLRYSDEFVDLILSNDDPREDNLIETYKSDGSIDNDVGLGNHLGRPNGINPGTNDFVFAQPRRDVMVTYDAPAIYLSFAESEFLRAEAIFRGWLSGDAQAAYESGVYAACKQLELLYPNAEPIADADIFDYLEENRIEYDTDDALEQINTQKWIALLFDGFEAYANYRRTGYPDITPGFADGESDGEIPRRLRYPIDEKVNNAQNYNEAVARLPEGDVITARMWWDVE